MTILVLILGLGGESKVSRDWTVALLLVAATAYIFAAGLLANCMNVGVLATLSKGRVPVFPIQLRTFSIGIHLFHLGNVFPGPFADDGLYQLSHVLAPVLRCRAAQRATINPSLPFPENREMAFSFPENASYHTSHFPREGHPRDILSSCTSSVNPGSRCRERRTGR